MLISLRRTWKSTPGIVVSLVTAAGSALAEQRRGTGTYSHSSALAKRFASRELPAAVMRCVR
jgi:hypothetical protein